MERLRHFFRDLTNTVEEYEESIKKHINGVRADLRAVGFSTTAEDAVSLMSYLTQMRLGNGVDARAMRQEQLMSWLFKLLLQPKSGFGTALEAAVIRVLWNALPHPSPSRAHYSGPQYRRADGSNNNPNAHEVGMSGGRYIRDVITRNVDTCRAQKLLKNGKGLPAPEDIFEKLFKRRRSAAEGGFKPHPCAISANMFYMATFVTHELFNIDITDRFRNKQTSYIDLS
jgi:linoleate 10R-lipoxygenase